MTCGDWPSQMAGRAVRATRSRRLRRSSAGSSTQRLAGAVLSALSWLACGPSVPRRWLPAAEFQKKLVGRDKEWILMESPADDRHRMSTQDVHHQASAELREIVAAYEWIGMAGREVVDPGLVLDQVIDTRSILEGPFHRRHESRQRESLGLPGA